MNPGTFGTLVGVGGGRIKERRLLAEGMVRAVGVVEDKPVGELLVEEV
jgi:hypothetical protein